MKLKKEKGFTLIELLVVVAIVVVLAGTLVLAINPVALLQKGRDAKRLEDLDALNKAISLALADSEITLVANNGTSSSIATASNINGADGYVTFTIPTGKTGLAKFIPTLPLDPLNTGVNVYTYGATTTNYELNAVLESADNTAKMSTDGGDDNAVYEIGTSLTIL